MVAYSLIGRLEELAARVPHKSLLDAGRRVEGPLRVPESAHRERGDARWLIERDLRRVERAGRDARVREGGRAAGR